MNKNPLKRHKVNSLPNAHSPMPNQNNFQQKENEFLIPDFADDPDSASAPEFDFLFEDDGKYYDCCHCRGQGFLYGDSGRICPECDGSGIGGIY